METTDFGDRGEGREDLGLLWSWALQLLSENDTTPAQPMATSSHCCRWCDGCKVGMDFDMRELSLETEEKGGIIFTLIFLES